MTAFCMCVLLAAAPVEVEISPLSGPAVRGTLAAWELQSLAVDAAGGRKSFLFDQLAAVTFVKATPKAAAPIAIELIDGSTALGATLTGGPSGVTLGVEGGSVEFPTAALRSVRLQTHGETTPAQWDKLRRSQAASDMLVTRKGDTLDYLRGAVRGIAADVVTFELDGEAIPVKRAKVFGILFHQAAGGKLPEAIGRLTETDGSIWTLHAVQLRGDSLAWTTPAGVRRERSVEAILRADFASTNVVALGDLPWESVEWKPFFQLGESADVRRALYQPRKDRSLLSGPMQLDGKEYAKGISLHSHTTLVYRLPDRFRTFSALVGIDDRVRPGGHVQLVVRGDDRVLLDTTLSGAQAAKAISVDVTGVRRLSIVVDFGDDMDIGDYVDLCDAKLVK